MTSKKRKKSYSKDFGTRAMHAALFAVVPIACFYLMESIDRNPFAQIRPDAHYLNIALFEILFGILYLMIGSMKWALRAGILLAASAGVVNHYVMLFRSTPFVPWDLYSVRTAASVVGEYEFSFEGRVIGILAGFALLFLLVRYLDDRLRWKAIGRIPVFLVACVILTLFAGRLQDESFQSRHNLYPFLFTPGVMVKYNGFAVTFTMDMAYLKIDKPEGYDKAAAESLWEEYQLKSAEEVRLLENVPAEDMPNIIVIMDEAFSDLAVLGDFETSADYMPFLHYLQEEGENAVSGRLQVSVCGGNTANTEFEYLTGHTMEFLPGGSIPYQQYIRKELPTMASWLRELGYETYAQHPYQASGWQRDKVYPLMGFEDLKFLPDYKPYHKVRNYVSDSSDFDRILQTLRESDPGKPAFIFNVTMQNHGGYTERYDDFTNTITAPYENPALDQYLTLLSMTDQALERLLKKLADYPEKTIVVFFGDHQPNNTVAGSVLRANGFDYHNLPEEEEELRYQVPYLIWANYDIEAERGRDTVSSMLGGHTLRAAGLPLSPYQLFLEELENSGEMDEKKVVYQMLQYYQLFDNK